MLHVERKELAENLRAVTEYNRELELEMNSLKPEIIELYKEREQHQGWLLSRGAQVTEINRLLFQSIREIPHSEEKSWLMPGIDRDQAVELLQGKVDGTFLVRWSSRKHQHVLSVKCGNKIQNWLIFKRSHGYSFAEPDRVTPYRCTGKLHVYSSLKELVLHYVNTGLEEQLQTTLKFPVGGC